MKKNAKSLTLSRRAFAIGLTTLLLPASRAYAQQSGSFGSVVGDMISYFDRSADISEHSPPPGYNAANGYFTTGILNDPGLSAHEAVRNDHETRLIAEVFNRYTVGIRNAFSQGDPGRPGLHFATGLTYLPTVFDVIQATWPQIVRFTAAVITVYVTDGDEEALANLAEAGREIGQALHNAHFISSGTHANGWIARGVQGEMANLVTFIDSQRGTEGATPRVQRVVDVLRAMAVRLQMLPVDHEDPWLRADWQYGYQIISEAGSRKLANTLAQFG